MHMFGASGAFAGALILAAFAGSPFQAAAQSQPAQAAPEPQATSVSLNALLDSGYEIRTMVTISNDDQKVIWPNDPVGPYVLMVLQKGASMASCIVGTGSVVSVSPTQLAQTNICKKR